MGQIICHLVLLPQFICLIQLLSRTHTWKWPFINLIVTHTTQYWATKVVSGIHKFLIPQFMDKPVHIREHDGGHIYSKGWIWNLNLSIIVIRYHTLNLYVICHDIFCVALGNGQGSQTFQQKLFQRRPSDHFGVGSIHKSSGNKKR